MSLFDATIPANTEAVKLGAQRIRELKGWLNSTLGAIFSDTVPTWVVNIIPGASLVNASVGTTQLTDASVTNPKLGPGAVTAAKATPDAYFYGVAGGTANVITLTLSPALAALVAGAELSFIALATNTLPATLNVNALGAKALLKNGGTALAPGDIVAAQIVKATYDGTSWQITSTTPNLVDSASARFAGIGRAWVKFDGTASMTLNANAAPTFTYVNATKVVTTSSPPAITLGQAVGVYSVAGLPTGMANGVVYYAGAVTGSSFKLYNTQAGAIAATVGDLVTTSSNGSPTCYFLYATIKAAFNVAAVVPVVNPTFIGSGSFFNAYRVYFTTPPASAEFVTVGSGKAGAASYRAAVSVDENDAGVTTYKQVACYAGSVADGAISYPTGLPETNVACFWN